VRLVGVPPVIEQEWDPDPLSWGADEYEVLVDAERGVLLRCASRPRSKDFDALEVDLLLGPQSVPHNEARRISTEAYSRNHVEVGFSEVCIRHSPGPRTLR